MNLGKTNLGKANLGGTPTPATAPTVTTDEQALWVDGRPTSTAVDGAGQAGWEDGRPSANDVWVAPSGTTISGATGISSGEAFGSDGAVLILDQTIVGAAGITSAENFPTGGEVLLLDQFVSGAAGIPSEEAFGAGDVWGPLYILGDAGLGTAETFGVGIIAGPINGTTGIPSGETFGTGGSLSTGTITGASGIASGETFGIDGSLGSIGGPVDGTYVPGILSAESFGVGVIAGPVSGVTGIPSEEALGTDGLVAAPITGVTGIPSEEYFPTAGRIGKGIAGYLGISSEEAFGRAGAVLGLTNAHTNFALYLGGINRTPFLRAETLSVDRQLNFQATSRMTLMIRDGSGYKPTAGMEVVLYFWLEDSGTWERIFAGSVDNVDTVRNPGGDEVTHQLLCADYGKALSRRLVNMKFAAASYGSFESIMEWLSDNILASEGIEWIRMGTAPVAVQDLEFNYVPCNEVMDRLMEIVGWEWQVDFDKQLRAYDRPSAIMSAPFDITEETSGNNGRLWYDLTTRESRGLYRNRQYIKATFSTKTKTLIENYTVPTNEPVPAYAQEKYFDGQFLKDQRYYGNVLRIVSIKKNGTDLIWYSQFADTSLSVFNTPPANWDFMQIWPTDTQLIWNLMGKPGLQPTTGDVVTIEFEMAMDTPPAIMVENTAAIAARKYIEGGSGIYEAVEEIADIEDADVLTAMAQQLLDRFSVMGEEVDFSTRRWGLQPGMEITADLPTNGVPSQLMTVERISYTEQAKARLLSTVTISNQVQQRDALSAFQRLIRRIRKTPSRPTQSITFTLAETIQGITNPGLITGTNLTSAYPLRKKFTVNEAALYFKTAPTGADIKVNIKADGASILPSGQYIQFPIGQTSPIVWSSFANAPLTLAKGSVLTVDVIQVGSGQPGKDGTLVLTGYV